MKNIYAVLCLIKSHETARGETLNFECGEIIGVFPVFRTKKAAKKFSGKREIVKFKMESK